ncbi:iron ABC transporter permease [Clostridium botulinum]|uniref:Iron ABC transporter permease n=1 Tax=Clostridium botulinum TaxID=1491 RepID=A0A846J4G7_CLOBO|nr:iron ABC transporter permease [Clostridium botulinum]ACA57066.1 ferrichrome transport system permease protein FhuG [Clostridium botulinum A3 str. Loch Maree]NFH64417.1 iron ABC transporter permease [Clostridium botulinum]NFJ08151.1 iron ABC transporter permease [Clostridium botulinum]NFK15917.1 iron ABC transporter permease [Clostridium botulinum]NFM93185.1 iron ABC transporter permease [Clostridium botulinum]
MKKCGMYKKIATIFALTLLLFIAIIISMNLGKMNLAPNEVLNVILGKGTDKQNLIVFEFRLPRIVLSILVGIGMAISGCILQALFRNDLADPGILGISSGSGLFILIYISIFSVKGIPSAIALPLLSFVGGMIAAILIYILSYKRNSDISPTRLVLTGVAMNTGFGAMSLFITLKLDRNQFEFAQKLLVGSLWGDDWKYIIILLPWIIMFSLYVFYKARALNVLNLGNQLATGLGVPVKKDFLALSIAAVALASGSAALGGSMFFIGLISPHIARKLVGPNHKVLIPSCALIGSLIMIIADTITRTVSFGADMPTGIILTIISTPYFIYLLARSN